MRPIEKVWGTTEPLVVTPMFEMHRLIVKPWHRCSLHRHIFKHNAFYVCKGEIFIDVCNELIFAQRLIPHFLVAGSYMTIEPGIRHQFRRDGGDGTTIMLEMYYTEPLSEDIIRDNVGGAC